MVDVLQFQDARKLSTSRKCHVLLGNGFSIACRPDIFIYKKLFEQADFSRLSPSAKGAFSALATTDFERVIKALGDSSKLLSVYPNSSIELLNALKSDAFGLRDLLVSTIAASHPDRPSDISDNEYAACRTFLRNFDTVYTLNYDLLLYWAVMHTEDGESLTSDDGFRKPEDDYDARYVTWEPGQSHDQNIWYLHGALHVFDAGIEVQKYTWINTGVRLIEQIRDALSRDYYPLFVAEGTSNEKLERIRHSDYLAKAYRSFQGITGSLFVYGHSFSSNDEHYLKLIEKGKIRQLFVGLHGDSNTEKNQAIIARAQRMTTVRNPVRPLEVIFFDTNSVKVWGHS